MSNRLVGALSRRRGPAITLCCAFQPPEATSLGSHSRGSARFSGSASVSFCLDGSTVAQRADDAKCTSKIGAGRTVVDRMSQNACLEIHRGAGWISELFT